MSRIVSSVNFFPSRLPSRTGRLLGRTGLFCLVFILPLRAQEPPVEQVLTLSQSLQRGLQNNQKLLLAQDDIRIAEQRVREAEAQYYPQVGLNFNGSRYLGERDYAMPPEFGSTLFPPSRALKSDSFYSARAWLKQPLYSGGRVRSNIRLSETSLEQARIQYETIRSQVVLDVTKAFCDVLLRRKEIQLYEDAVNAVETLAGQLPAGDYRRQAEMRAIRNRLRRGLSEKRHLAEKARLDFLNTLGLELYTRVGLEGELKKTNFNMDLEKLLAWAAESRSEIRRTDFQREIDRLTVNLFQAERHPVVAFGAGYELNDPEFPLKTNQWNATLNVSLPIFDGFSSRTRIRQRKIQANQSRIQRTEIEDQVNWEVRESYAELMYWQAERATREEDLHRAETAVANLPKADPLDQSQGKAWLLESQESYWESVHAGQVSLAKLEKAVGRPLSD